MRGFLTAGAVIAALITATTAQANDEGCTQEKGNWYCKPVERIEYNGVGGAGSYNKVTKMVEETGACSFAPQSYTGSMSPMNEEVSLHFKGPLSLKQFAVWTPSASGTTKAKRSSPHARRNAHAHGHQHFHEHNKEIREAQELAAVEERAIGDIVVVTMNGKVVSWTNQYDGKAVAAATPAASSAARSPAAATTAAAAPARARPSAGSSVVASPKASSAPAVYGSGGWTRTAYYNFESKIADGLVFLNNQGGLEDENKKTSGVWSKTFGNSLSYASANGATARDGPEFFGSVLRSGREITIMSDKKCSESSCGYYREGSVAYQGFAGPQKAFFFEFDMPDDGNTAQGMNMPAIWMLNAQIPRTVQYGPCSCWQSGCGEFDIFEVLDPGNKRCKSTLHGNISGGSSYYFDRPVQKTIKVATVMHNDNIVVQVLDDNFDFSAVTDQAIKEICDNTASVVSKNFALQ